MLQNRLGLLVLILICLTACGDPPRETGAKVWDKMMGAVARVVAPSRTSGGTAWLTTTPSGKSVLVTNAHVCGQDKDGFAVSGYWTKPFIAAVLAVSVPEDLCILSVREDHSGVPLALADSAPKQKDKLMIGGFPGLKSFTVSRGVMIEPSIKEAVVSLEDCQQPKHRMEMSIFGPVCLRTMEVNALSNHTAPGGSGSPVLTMDGKVVGVVVAIDEETGLSYALRLENLRAFLSAY